jgi:hypothetical protein
VPDATPAIDFRLAPEYRRCAVYVAIGFALVVGLLAGFKLTGVEDVPWANVATALVSCGAAAVGLLALTFRYRLRIDPHGVWRRRLVRWDLWPWEAFEAGQVRHGRLGDQLAYPDKGWYWRTLSTSLLGEADRGAFEAAVRRYWVPPPPPDLPEVVALRQGVRTDLELSTDGVRLGDGEVIPWPDVVRVELVRANPGRPDFLTLDLHLPNRPKPIRLFRRSGRQSWKGPDAAVIAHYLRRHLGDGRFQVTALGGPPADAAEADRRLARLAEIERQFRLTGRFTNGALAVLAVVMLQPWEWRNPRNWGNADWVDVGIQIGAVTLVLGLFGAMIRGVAYFQGRELRRQRGELLAWKAAGRVQLNPEGP